MENNIEIKDLSFKYDQAEKYILEDINFTIKEGEFVCILGHNGSGKSTLAKLINAQILPSKGDVLVGGMNTKDEDKIWDIREMCGMVFQNPDNQLVATIVEEEVAFGPENLGIAKPELLERVDKALDLVGMSEYRKHSPALLSGGQKQRIAIASVLAMNPKCLVMDEPTAMLDPAGRKDIIDIILKLRDMGSSIVHITHYMEECIYADRLIIVDGGKIVMEGKPASIFSQVELIKALGLDVPEASEIAYLLNKDGYDIGKDILSIDDLVKAL